MTEEKSNTKRVVAIAGIIGALAAILISIITARNHFSFIIFQTIVISLLVVIIILLWYGFIAQPLGRFFKRQTVAIKHLFLTKKYFREFNIFVDKLGEFLEPRRCDNIPYTLNKLQNNKPMFPDVSFTSVKYFNDLFIVLQNAVGKLRKSKESFLLLIKLFESILNAYNEICVFEPVKQTCIIIKQGRGGISDDIKQEYRKNKTVYEKFILEYVDFAKRVNKDFQERVAREYFEVPNEL